jgi:serine/threonine-protein kinase
MMVGRTIGPYSIIAKLGEGGMGAVFRARDTQLGRDVALKLLPGSFSQDPDRVTRFAREAQVLASLNHPNVATIYGLERLDGHQVIVMELVEGSTLEERLARGPLSVEDVRRVGIQIAEALDAAHERGIVHRDLKPSNVIVRPDGAVKVLDFGLAKTRELAGVGSAPSILPTVTGAAATHAGIILGTAPYMSPEQARGVAIDRRTDVWALGCLLYESITGSRAFDGPTLSDTIALVLKSDPDWSRIAAGTPPSLTGLIRRCLRKEPRQRIQSAGEVRLALEEMDASDGTPAVSRAARTPWLIPGAAAVLFAGALAAAVYAIRPARENVAAPGTPVRVSVQLPRNGPVWFDDGVSLAISRDGRRLAWVGGSGSSRRLWIRDIDQLQGQALEGTEEASTPFFSPDGEWVAFFTTTELKKIKLAGGAPITIAVVNDRGRGGAWGDDGSIVFASGIDAPLQRLPASGGSAAAVTRLPEGEVPSHRFPAWVPGRQALVYAVRHATGASTLSRSSLATVDLSSGTEKPLLDDAEQPTFLPTGDLLFLRNTAIYLVEFDADTLSTRGEPKVVVAGVQFNSNSRSGQYAAGGSRLAYMAGPDSVSESVNIVEWRGMTGQPRILIKEPDTYRDLRFSPDGRRLAYAAFPQDAASTDLWVYDLFRDVKMRLAGGPKAAWRPVWSRDGAFIIYADYPGGMKRIRADGSGQPEQLTTTAQNITQVPLSISPDGKYLAYHENEVKQHADIWLLPLEPPAAPWRFFASAANDTLPMFSPDGRWIAYASNESGANELYVRSFPKADAKWRVSSSGTLDEHAWSRDGKKLFFRSGDGQQIMSVPITVTGAMLDIGRAVPILQLQSEDYPELSFWGGLSLSPDDQGFALAKYAEQVVGDRSHLVLMVDWVESIKGNSSGSPIR